MSETIVSKRDDISLSGPKVRASEAVVALVRVFIETNNFAPGDALPPERELAKSFGVSRHTLREALRIMEERGVVVSRRGSGTYIAPVTLPQLQSALLQCLQSEVRHLKEIFQFRELLEPQVAALAAAVASPEDIDRLRELVETQEKTRNQSELNELDTEFHMVIAYASGNTLLGDMISQVSRDLKKARTTHLIDKTRQDLSLAGHKAILNALCKRDPAEAEGAMRDHIFGIGDWIFNKYRADAGLS